MKFFFSGFALLIFSVHIVFAGKTLLNVSYDPTREFYQDINTAFSADWRKRTGEAITIKQSHGGSGKQARAVIDGLEADVVTLALGHDIDALANKGKLIPTNWQKRLPNNSSPYTSTIIFLVKKGNPKKIKDWDDLARKGIKVVTPNPKTSGGARWNYLAAYGYALKKNDGNETEAKKFIDQLYRNVPVLDAGARGSTTTFVQRGIGDVLVSWENEALLVLNELVKGKYEVIYPSSSILAEPPVCVVDKVADKRGTRKIADAYLQFLYTDAGQEIAAKHYFRPSNKMIADQYQQTFPKIKMFTIDEVFGGWQKAQKIHFDEGGWFDQISKSRR